ncbi:uroporphyrinogen-III C-methyltransferase [Methylovirgula ligni]|uniref:uroporphyrinogen-III C-methyltransferase n=1 Tax=Methylovirgula ligni TaxID=569860 RepID=A0A3D9Z1M4_9HYPH|nr:uroporphyrinogen-III C-methyltransferase [Methylovirgula ligni]QAY95583.1 uroporphyrinogen-III C-methyltransferase [Methylovirgula ligni]REF89072.1 uroporphyrin-III C-methyltransferase [Methylovirgula ligni]
MDVEPAAFEELPFEPGTVWLVGAGPGDPGLLTLHALSALRRADVIVHDALVSDRVMALASTTARREYAGKRGGRPSHSQHDISERLVALARQNLRVLRLKGGDPFIFGRGGEEAKALAEAGVCFRVVPGITAGIGGLAYAGIPATSRETNQALVLVAGHPAGDGEDRIDWEALGALGEPLVIYMGLSRLPEIGGRLIAGGLSPATKLAILTQATLASQSIVETTLGEAIADHPESPATAPTLIVIGAVIDLRHALLAHLIAP